MSDNPAKVSFPFHLGGPGTMTADKQFSLYVSRTLDCLGKHQDMVKFRVKFNRKLQEHQNILYRPFGYIIAGSKAEGLTSVYESDKDIMFVLPDVICADNVRTFIHNRNTTVFQTARYDSPVGYTKLKLVKYESILSNFVINYSMFDNDSEYKHLSSDLFVTNMYIAMGFNESNTTGSINNYERSGPSLPASDPEGHLHEDRVFSLRCVCPSIFQTFLTRPRPHNRPSGNELRDISVMDTHVVPVGHKRSNESHNEWRICFTKAEIYLVQRLNETERKLYILLKMTSKLLKFISNNITSYIMKNIVLWLVELCPVDLFTEDLLTYQLIQALRFLQRCVEASFLPSYMIPERNLFSERLDPIQRLQLTTFLSTLIQERGYLLMRCEKLRYGITILYREPDMAVEFRRRRDMMEKLHLLWDYIRHEKEVTTGLSTEENKRQMYTQGIVINKLLCPDLMFLLRQGRSAEEVADLITERFLQMLA